MALTRLQRTICRLIADHRIASGESYVAGGVALNELLRAPRVSRDIDLFHNTEEALEATWNADRRLLEERGFAVQVLRQRASFVEVEVSRDDDRVRIQWARDSAYRFFPLVQHEELGLTLHPVDLATNKVLALVGRLEVRDWIDVVECNDRLQPLGYLAWAACGKDPGFSPAAILEQAGRSSRYSTDEVQQLAFGGQPPDAAVLSRRWHDMLETGKCIVDSLPAEEVGRCVLTPSGELLRARPSELAAIVNDGQVLFHPGAIRGALPSLGEESTDS